MNEGGLVASTHFSRLYLFSSPDYLLPVLLRYIEDPTIQPVTNNFFGTMALRYNGVPSKSCKQARAGRK